MFEFKISTFSRVLVRGLLILILTISLNSCKSTNLSHEFEFVLDTGPEAMGTTESALDVAFFVSDVYLITAMGEKFPLQLSSNNWQVDNAALIILGNDATGTYNNIISGSTPALNASKDTFNKLEFTLGLPAHLNHSNPLTAKPPLNTSSMFWSWQLGYKFLRIDSRSETLSWSFHLGSTNCSSPSPIRPPTAPCEKPNRVNITLPLDNKSSSHIFVNVGAFSKHPIGKKTVSCTGQYSENPICSTWLGELGLNPSTGRCTISCDEQALFYTTRESVKTSVQ